MGDLQTIHGAVLTPAGDKLPMRVDMRPVTGAPGYSHIGELTIPSQWLQDFAAALRGFIFRSEDGECFTQFQILEEDSAEVEVGAAGARGVTRRGRIILMRDVGQAQPDQPDVAAVGSNGATNGAKAKHLQVVGV